MATKGKQLLNHIASKNKKIKHGGRYDLPRKFEVGTKIIFNKNGGYIKRGK